MKPKSPYVLRLLGRVLLNFHNDHGLGLSASVAFYSLLSFGPVIYLASLLASRLFESPDAIREAVARLGAFLPQNVAGEVERFALGLQAGGSLALIAVPGLIWVGSSAFLALEYAINVAFATLPRRSILRSRVKALILLFIGGSLLLSMMIVPTVLAGLRGIERALDVPVFAHVVLDRGSYPLMLLVTLATFVFFFKLCPRGRVAHGPALTGATLSLVLWELARKLYAGILTASFAYGLLGSALAGIVAFLLWIQTAVIAILLGAELAALLNGNRTLARRERSPGGSA